MKYRYEGSYASKYYNSDEMDQVLGIYKPSKLQTLKKTWINLNILMYILILVFK